MGEPAEETALYTWCVKNRKFAHSIDGLVGCRLHPLCARKAALDTTFSCWDRHLPFQSTGCSMRKRISPWLGEKPSLAATIMSPD